MFIGYATPQDRAQAMENLDLSTEEIERFALFILGVAIGLVLVCAIFSVVEEWVIASDLADRRRIREILREMLGREDQAQELGRREPQAEQLTSAELPPSVTAI
jgi:hypothetical protein